MMTDTEKFQHLLKVLKNYAEKEHCYDKEGDDYTPANNCTYDEAFDDGAEYGEILFARTLLEFIEADFKYPCMEEMTDPQMTDQQIAQEVLYAYMNVEGIYPQPQILIHTLKELQKLMTGNPLNWEDEQSIMYEFGWTDCLKQIDAVCDELENL